MFEQCVPARPVSKDEYKREEAALRVDLINAQYDLRLEPFPVLLLVNGDFQGGCDDVVDLLHEWMDARYMLTSVFESPTDEESQRPRFWRYWRALPPDGRIGVFLGAWTLRAIADRALGHCDDADFARRIDHVRRFERMLVEDGALVLKFWIHAPDRRTPEGRKKRKRAPVLSVSAATERPTGASTTTPRRRDRSRSATCARRRPRSRRGCSWTAPTSGTATSS